jgi:hopanoid biosynthesis associated RND transporter like protein HpnN
MLTVLIVRLIGLCTRHARLVVLVALALTIASGFYSARHFAINSDINTLLSSNLDWRKREVAFEKAFNRYNIIIAVVEAPTPELAGQATAALTTALAADKQRFLEVTRLGGGPFFDREGLLFLTPEALATTVAQLKRGEPLIHDLNIDQSLRGLVSGLEDGLLGLQQGELKLDDFTRVLDAASDTAEAVIAGRPAAFSWRALVEGHPPTPSERRGFIEVRPILDYGAIEAGHAATEAIRQVAADVASRYQATVRLTGPVAMADEEFATIKEGAVRNGTITLVIVLFILWLALRSGRLILAVAVNLFVGLALTAALGLMMVGALNLISVYFAVLFVGIGVDFGIQFSVRYRAERHEFDDLPTALARAGRFVGAPLTLAAAATAAGFLSFLPTEYRGVSELGLIAGCGMLIALLTSVSLLPALISLLKPRGEPAELGFRFLAPFDDFLERNRIPFIICTAAVVVIGLPLLYWLRFDFNPIHLRDPRTESIATYLDLTRDPTTNPNTIEVLAPSLADADAIAARLAKVPEVSRATTLSSFVPDRQAEKLPMIADLAGTFADAFDPANRLPPPSDSENVDALKEGADRLTAAAGDQAGPGATAAKRLAAALTRIADGPKDLRDRTAAAFIPSLQVALAGLQATMQATPVTPDTLPPDIVRAWMTPDKQARVEVSAKGAASDNEAMRQFARAVLAVEPTAVEGPISVLRAGDTIVQAFIAAGLWALGSIAIILWIVLRRVGDVLLTIVPLLLAGVVTLEACVLVGLQLNFANIIALPLLLGVGVAFKIYYIMAWRAGQTHLLQTSLTRAVFFSALTTATAFGSLWFSSHPGTSSMGQLLALSLLCTLFAAVVFQPLLMGKPRDIVTER